MARGGAGLRAGGAAEPSLRGRAARAAAGRRWDDRGGDGPAEATPLCAQRSTNCASAAAAGPAPISRSCSSPSSSAPACRGRGRTSGCRGRAVTASRSTRCGATSGSQSSWTAGAITATGTPSSATGASRTHCCSRAGPSCASPTPTSRAGRARPPRCSGRRYARELCHPIRRSDALDDTGLPVVRRGEWGGPTRAGVSRRWGRGDWLPRTAACPSCRSDGRRRG